MFKSSKKFLLPLALPFFLSACDLVDDDDNEDSGVNSYEENLALAMDVFITAVQVAHHDLLS